MLYLFYRQFQTKQFQRMIQFMALLKEQQQIVYYLAANIKNGEYGVNSKIPTEKQLSEQFHVNRNTVRESLKILQFMGVLSSSQGSGYRVADDMSNALSSTMQIFLASIGYTYKSISEIREALELKSFILARGKISSTDIAYLDNLVNAMHTTEDIATVDAEFHKALAKLSGNPIIETVTNAIASISESYILIPWANLSNSEKEELIETHHQILQGLTQGGGIIDENPVSRHYSLADQILEAHHKNLLLSSVPDTANMSLNQFIESGLSGEEILQLISKIKDN